MNLLLLSFEGAVSRPDPLPTPRETAAQTLAVPASFPGTGSGSRRSGRHGRPRGQERAWAEASYWLSAMSVAVAAPLVQWGPMRRTLRPGGRGGRVGRGAAEELGSQPAEPPAAWAPGRQHRCSRTTGWGTG